MSRASRTNNHVRRWKVAFPLPFATGTSQQQETAMKSNVLLEGEVGTGKTRALITLLPEYIDERGKTQRGAGLHPFLISMEPGAEATLGPNLCGTPGAPSPAIHLHYIAPAKIDWQTISNYVRLANTVPLDALLKQTDPARNQYRQFMELFSVCQDFVCDNCGESFGDVGEWGEDRAAALDGLTGLTTAAVQNLVGGKPIRSLPEIGTIMEFIEGFMKLWWGNTRCTAILLAHVDREVSPLTGQSIITAHTIGQKLAPRLVKMPDEVIVAQRSDDTYTWSTAAHGIELKRRRLPRADDLAPDFAQLFNGQQQ